MSSQRRVLVTGGASGIGLATVRALLDQGARVAALDRQPIPVEHPSLKRLTTDLRSEDDVREALGHVVDWLGHIDALAHVAGIAIGQHISVDALGLPIWDEVVDVNLTGSFLMVKHALPHFAETGGVVVLTGSGAGVFGGHSSVAYAASKGGMNGLVLSLEQPLKARGIRINLLAPGAVDTPMVKQGPHAGQPERKAVAVELQPPERIADVLCFLLSDQAQAVRGVVRTF